MRAELPLIQRRRRPLLGVEVPNTERTKFGKHVYIKRDIMAQYDSMAPRFGYTSERLVDRALRYWIANVREHRDSEL